MPFICLTQRSHFVCREVCRGHLQVWRKVREWSVCLSNYVPNHAWSSVWQWRADVHQRVWDEEVSLRSGNGHWGCTRWGLRRGPHQCGFRIRRYLHVVFWHDTVPQILCSNVLFCFLNSFIVSSVASVFKNWAATGNHCIFIPWPKDPSENCPELCEISIGMFSYICTST